MKKVRNISLMCLPFLAVGSASAASITWQPVVTNTTAADIITGGTLHASSNSAGPADQTINGVTFLADSGGPLTSNAAGTFYTTGSGVNTTGDAGLDALLDSHSYVVGGAGTSFDIVGLTVGNLYEIQIIAVGDTRGCCSARTQSFSGDQIDSSGALTRQDPSSVVGSFTADAATQTIFVTGATDPGLSGYQVRDLGAVPEPSTALLSLAGLIGLVGRRRR